MPQAIRMHEVGGPEVLRWEEVEVPSPGPGEVRVRHTAIGVNFVDTYHRSGLYPMQLPGILGSEAAGVVEAVGEGVTEVGVGARVAYAGGPQGAYAQARCIAASHLVPLPDDIEDETAAAILLKGLTVEYLIRRTFTVGPGMTVLLHAAAGGVGLIACQWLAYLGAQVIGTVGSDEKAQLAKANGAHHTIVYTREDFPARVRALTGGEGVPVVYDSVGRATFMGSLDCLSPRGLLVSFGNASGRPDPIDPLVLSAKGSLYLTRPTLKTYVARREELLGGAEALFEVVRSRRVRTHVHQRWPLREAAEAHRALERRATMGSLLLVP